MCGKETTGLEAADPAIFKGSKYILTKTNKTDIKRLKVGDRVLLSGQIFTARDVPKASVSLPVSTLPASIDLVQAMGNGKANTIAHYEAKNIDLPAGEYRAIIRIEASEKESKYSKEFTVGLKPEDLIWESV